MEGTRPQRDKGGRSGTRPPGRPGAKRGSRAKAVAVVAGALVVLALLVRLAAAPGGRVPTGPLGPDAPRAQVLAAARAGRISALWRGGETRPILDPARFRGQRFMGLDVEAGYRAAAEVPDVLDELFCYCFCEDPRHAPMHRSLRSCFTDAHATQCTVCLREALRARELVQEGLPLPEIERRIDAEFSGA